MALVLKICGSEWNNASRDKRELSVYREMGYDVAVLAKGHPEDKGREEYVDGFKVFRYSTRPLGAKAPDFINRFFSLFTWARFARKLKPCVISGHDLVPGLTIGWMSTFFNRREAKLIYDSHEFELGRNIKRGKLSLYLVKRWEKFMINRSAFSIVVDESIADEIQKLYNPQKPVIVLRSTPASWDIDDTECIKMRKEILGCFERDL